LGIRISLDEIRADEFAAMVILEEEQHQRDIETTRRGNSP